jgi:hypothetical protein
MAVERDSSYTAYAPADTRELLDQLREEGHEIPNPVWTVGRLDEREKNEKTPSETPDSGGDEDGEGPG